MQIRHGMNWILEVNRKKTNDCFSICSCTKNLFTAADFSFASMTSSSVGQKCLSLTEPTLAQETLGQSSKRPICCERDPVQLAVLRVKVGHGVVLGGSVVPHGQ